ncbi:YeiH family protein [bacterium]|nr:YeiH family protein [bacterium]
MATQTSQSTPPESTVVEVQHVNRWRELLTSEDWWAVWIGFILIVGAAAGWIGKVPKLGKWDTNPLDVFYSGDQSLWIPLLLTMLGLGLLFTVANRLIRGRVGAYPLGYLVVFTLATVSYLLAHQLQVSAYGLGYAFWALLIGLLISNTIGTPKWLLEGSCCETYIKTGLVLLGAEILFSKILALGGPGLLVAWVVTPIVIIFMFNFGVKVLKMKSKALTIVIAAATSVCGVSAAIATAAASRARKNELALAVGMTLIFTVLMMIFMPMLIKGVGMDPIVGGAWMGGTIDATGAVVAAGAFLGEDAEKVAAVVKMIQNVLIGLVAFVVAVYWTTNVERTKGAPRVPAMEIWYRFPKFIVGFVAASLVFSFILVPSMGLEAVEAEVLKPVTVKLRGWLFCMAFVSIGLESNFKELASQMAGGKPMILYVVGQSFNLILTLLMAWLAFGGVLFDKVF